MASDLKQLAKYELFEVWQDGHVELIDTLYSPDFVNHNVNCQPGRAGLKQSAEAEQERFTELRFEIQALLSEGNLVTRRWSMTAKERKSGSRTEFTGTDTLRVLDGLIVEAWTDVTLIVPKSGISLSRSGR